MPWRKPSSRQFFLDEPAAPHSISAALLHHLIGHREDDRRNGETDCLGALGTARTADRLPAKPCRHRSRRSSRSVTMRPSRRSPVVCITILTPPRPAYFAVSRSTTLYVTSKRSGSSSASPPERITRPVFSGSAPSSAGSARSRRSTTPLPETGDLWRPHGARTAGPARAGADHWHATSAVGERSAAPAPDRAGPRIARRLTGQSQSDECLYRRPTAN